MTVLWLDTALNETEREKLLAAVREGRLTAYRDRAGGDEAFGAWLYLVDRHMQRKYGITHADLGDFTWRDQYRDGSSPSAAALEALESDDLGAMILNDIG